MEPGLFNSVLRFPGLIIDDSFLSERLTFPFSIHPPGGPLGCHPVMGVVNIATVDTGVKVFLQHPYFISFGQMFRIRASKSQCDKSALVSLRNLHIASSEKLCLTDFPIKKKKQWFPFLQILLTLRLSDRSHSSRREMAGSFLWF